MNLVYIYLWDLPVSKADASNILSDWAQVYWDEDSYTQFRETGAQGNGGQEIRAWKSKTQETDSQKKGVQETDSQKKEAQETNGQETGRKEKEEEKKAAESKHASEYEVVLSDVTWKEASRQAEDRGGHLAVITSQEEEKAIQALIVKKGPIHTVWLGGFLKDNSFVWVNGEEFQYTNWGSGEPNNETGDEFYLDMYEIDGVWHWNDAPNDIKRYYSGRMGYVIEWEVQ